MIAAHAALYFATIALASPQSTVGLEYVETLPPPDAPQMHCVWAHTVGYASVRVLVGEVLERIGGHSQAINWAQADLQVRLRRKISFGVQFTLLVLTAGENQFECANKDTRGSALKQVPCSSRRACACRRRSRGSTQDGQGRHACLQRGHDDTAESAAG